MTAYYNEIDPYAAKWLENLIDGGHIAWGVVDTRSIREVTPDDVRGFTQVHFFAGIGVWSHALRRAGWPDDRPIWTGSCPCQPFSAAGTKKGYDDDRHLWPEMFRLIRECRPATIVGEQVASKDGLGWIDLVSGDVENAGYAFAAADLCAAGFGGAHLRQRLYWLAHTNNTRLERRGGAIGDDFRANGQTTACGSPIELANADGGGKARRRVCGPGESDSAGLGAARERSAGLCTGGGLADSTSSRRREERADPRGIAVGDRAQGRPAGPSSSGGDSWPNAPTLGRHAVDWLFCRDGKWRPVEPGSFPLAHAPAARVGRLRAYGNALDAETATGFIETVMGII